MDQETWAQIYYLCQGAPDEPLYFDRPETIDVIWDSHWASQCCRIPTLDVGGVSKLKSSCVSGKAA